MSDAPRQAVKSANRVLDLFELLGRWGAAMSHTEIAAALSIPKSSLSQLLPNLVDRGYLEFVPTTKGYRLGEKLIALVSQVTGRKNIEALVQPVLENLTAESGESSALNVLKGDMAEVVATVNSPKRLVSHMRNGDLAPLHATSGGKAILAFLSPVMIEEYIRNADFSAITPNTISSAEELRRQLATVVRERVAYSFEEFTPGIIGMSVPVLSNVGQPLGSINVAMPAVRYNTRVRDHLVDLLEKASATLRHQLGFGEPARKPGRQRAVG